MSLSESGLEIEQLAKEHFSIARAPRRYFQAGQRKKAIGMIRLLL